MKRTFQIFSIIGWKNISPKLGQISLVADGRRQGTQTKPKPIEKTRVEAGDDKKCVKVESGLTPLAEKAAGPGKPDNFLATATRRKSHYSLLPVG